MTESLSLDANGVAHRALQTARHLVARGHAPLPSRRVAAAIVEHRSDIVDLAGPFVLGVRGMAAAAARLGVPAVAIYGFPAPTRGAGPR